MNIPAPYEEEFRLRLRQATRARRSWVFASEVAGDLCYAAKALKKIADPERRFDGLCDFIFRGGEMLKRVDDSNASLQSVFWDGDVASQIWDATAPLVSDKEPKGALELIPSLYLLTHDPREVFRGNIIDLAMEWADTVPVKAMDEIQRACYRQMNAAFDVMPEDDSKKARRAGTTAGFPRSSTGQPKRTTGASGKSCGKSRSLRSRSSSGARESTQTVT